MISAIRIRFRDGSPTFTWPNAVDCDVTEDFIKVLGKDGQLLGQYSPATVCGWDKCYDVNPPTPEPEKCPKCGNVLYLQNVFEEGSF